MKPVLLMLCLCCCMGKVRAQGFSDCFGGDSPVHTVDSLYFENSFGPAKLVFDTTFTNNIWQVGAVQKAGFNSALSGTNALQTDTLSSYPIGNESAAILYFDTSGSWTTSFPKNFSLTFWHYYDTDTLTDSCILQFTVDSGKTWLNSAAMQQGGFGNIYYSGSLNNYSNNMWGSDTLCWSGNSSGWRKESLCVWYVAIKGMQIPRLYGIRFLFHSDTVQTNKPGWMIDNIQLKSPMFFAGINEANSGKGVSVFPNPSHSGIFSIDYPEHYVKGSIQVYDLMGKKLKSLELSPRVNISDLPKGTYFYRVVFDNTSQIYSGMIEYN